YPVSCTLINYPSNHLRYIIPFDTYPDTYDHRVWKIGLPVRSAVLKPHAGELVVGWVTTSESSLLVWKTGLPVRSAVLKPHAGELVVGWVTTSESSLLYVFLFSLTASVRGNYQCGSAPAYWKVPAS
ncbi:L-lysine 2-3-aminomutase, partial [Penicillium chrysogenum]